MKCRYRPVARLVSFHNNEGFKPAPGIRVSYVDHRPRFFLCLFNVVVGYWKFYVGITWI